MLDTLTLAELCQAGEPLVLGPEDPVSLAVSSMGERRVSSVVIAAQGRPVGILTERDVLALIAAGPFRSETRLCEVMTPDPVTAPLDMTFADGYARMAGHGVRHLVLIDADGRLCGILSETDFAHMLGAEELQGPRTVADLMTREPATVPPETPIAEALAFMAERHISSVIVAQADRALGILSERDAVRFAMSDLDLQTTPVAARMSHPLQTIDPECYAYEAGPRMRAAGVRHLVVEDEAGRLVGILTRRDLLRDIKDTHLRLLRRTIAEQGRALRDARQQLQEQGLLRAIFETSTAGIGLRDLEGRLVLANPALLAMLGYRDAPEALLGRDFAELMAVADRARDAAALTRLRAGEVPNDRMETQYLHRDGHPVVADVTVSAIRDPAGAMTHALAIVDDITGRKQAEAELRTIRNELEHAAFELTENIPVGTYTMVLPPGERAAHFSFLSKRFLELTGLDRQRTLADPLNAYACIHPDDRDHWRRINADAFARKRPFFGETRILVDGQVRWISAESIPHERPDGTTVWAGVLTDITVRKSMQERLRQSESRFRELFEHSPVAYQSLDEEGRYLDVNNELCALLGYERDALLGRNFGEFWAAERAHQFPGVFGRFKCQGQTSGELDLVRGDGSPLTVQLEGKIQRDADDRFIRTHCILYDITERKRRERELDQARQAANAANQAKSEFLALMSHEIRTPLNAVLGLAQVLNREPLTASQREMIGGIQDAGQSLLFILNDILDFSKVEAGQLRIEFRPFDPRSLLARLDRLMGHGAAAKGLVLQVAGPAAPLGHLIGDALRLEQVLANLLGNAIKFTHQGRVTLEVQVREVTATTVRLRFTVSDTGIGIDPATLPRLFAPFTQADEGIARRFGGTGLGLSLSKHLVELMGGEIGVDSRPGQGSTFWVEFPFARLTGGAAAFESPRTPASAAGPRLSGAHILVVDDSAMNRDLIERALRLEGASATPAADGLQAVQALRAEPTAFSAVLMDVRMPVMDGLTATRIIRQEPGLTALPIIALTAGVMAEQQAAARAAGVDDVLAKPVDLEQMVSGLLQWLGPAPRPPGALAPAAAAGRAPPSDAAPLASERAADPVDPLAAWLSLPGIDARRVAGTLGQDRAGFLRLLGSFTREFADAVAATRRDLDAGERDAAARRIHSLRGNAGILGAMDLMAAAGDLETAIDRGETALEAPLRTIGERLAALIEAGRPWLDAAGPAAPARAAAPPLDAGRLGDLRRALAANALKALALLDELAPALAGVLGWDRAESLRRTARELRFAEALAMLDQTAIDT